VPFIIDHMGRPNPAAGRDDPTLKARTDPETNQLIISGMGELHLEVSVEKLMRTPGVKVTVGKPLVAGAKVTGEIVEQTKGDKLVVFKFRLRKNYVRRNGHRQNLTAIKIAAIEG